MIPSIRGTVWFYDSCVLFFWKSLQNRDWPRFRLGQLFGEWSRNARRQAFLLGSEPRGWLLRSPGSVRLRIAPSKARSPDS